LYASPTGGDVSRVSQDLPLSSVGLWEHRDGGRRELHWIVLTPLLRGNVIAVHLHQTTTDGDGILLYDFPIDASRQWKNGELEQVTAGMAVGTASDAEGAWYRGAVPFRELMDRLFDMPIHLDVHTDSVPTGEFRAPLGTPTFQMTPENPAVWRPVYCD
jgi:hypothetical protein